MTTAPTLLSVQQAIQEQIHAAIPLLTCYSFSPGSIVAPAVIVDFGNDVTKYRGTFGSMSSTPGAGTGWSDTLPFKLWVFVGSQVDNASDAQLTEFIDMTGERSIPCALEADASLGGVLQANGLAVDSFQRLGLTQYEADPSNAWYETAAINLRVVMNRSGA